MGARCLLLGFVARLEGDPPMSRARIAHDPNDPRHGTVNGYHNLGCRCDACREANTKEHAAYMARNEWQRRLHAARENLRYLSGNSSHTYGPPGRKKRGEFRAARETERS